MHIRPSTAGDHDDIWRIFHAVVRTGDTYAFDPDISRSDAIAAWCASGVHTYVAEDDGQVVGTYILKANQPGLGSHVANAAFMVDPETQGKGVGRTMAEHCLDEARGLGFKAMQFNLVVAQNKPAVALWEKLGFETVGRLRGAFRHRADGLVDALVMYRVL